MLAMQEHLGTPGRFGMIVPNRHKRKMKSTRMPNRKRNHQAGKQGNKQLEVSIDFHTPNCTTFFPVRPREQLWMQDDCKV